MRSRQKNEDQKGKETEDCKVQSQPQRCLGRVAAEGGPFKQKETKSTQGGGEAHGGQMPVESKRTWFSSGQSLSRVQLFATPWTAAHQASLSITNSQSPPRPTCIESVMPSNHLVLCRPLLLLPSIFPSIRVFSNESALRHQVAKVLEFQLQHQSFQ